MNNQPLVTVALFAYNQEKYIVDAVRSVLAQDYSPLQIIISDDCSSDRTFARAAELVEQYDGPHRIQLNRNAENLGVGRHINRIMESAEGELIVAAGGDDISMPERVTETVKLWIDSGRKYYSICSLMDVMNEAGEVYLQMPRVDSASYQQVFRSGVRWMYGATHTWHTSTFAVFGPLRDDVVSEDNAIGFRSLLLGERIGCVEKPLVKYRFHPANITNGSTNIARIKQKIATYNSYIDDLNKAVTRLYPGQPAGREIVSGDYSTMR